MSSCYFDYFLCSNWSVANLSNCFVYVFSLILFIPYILVDASGWVISDVSFGFMGVSGLATSEPLTQMTQLALILLQLPSRQLTCASTQREKKMTTEKARYIILQQPIRAKLYWWLLNLSFKSREATLLCFFATMTSLFGYPFTPVCISFSPPPFFYTYRKKKFKNK